MDQVPRALALWPDLEFAALLAWTPDRLARDGEARKARNFIVGLKRDQIIPAAAHPTTAFVVRRLSELRHDLEFGDWFGPDVALIAMPKSSLMDPGTLWIPGRLVSALAENDLGYRTGCSLKREFAVPKAANSSSAHEGRRPDVHFDSLVVEACLEAPEEVVIVDDIVTSGASLLGAAARVREALPASRVRGFAVARTQSNAKKFQLLLDPVVGRIQHRPSGLAKRTP